VRAACAIVTEGPSSGQVVEFDELLDDYHAQRGWDADGQIMASKLEELGITDLRSALG
jgi:aldehyde:ferredoxin oxidoreductase